jgi:myo-inositol 2-dehydrogenase/D-chiro-inositol 1-dehydrogenase
MIRIGMVGTGAIAETHAGFLAQIDDVKVTGGFDAIPERAAEFARQHDATAYPTLDALLDNVDAIYIGTFPQAHREAAVRAAEAGVHIFCEKPLAATIEDGLAIQEAVERSKISFFTAFPFRFSRSFMRMKEVVDSGVLGAIYSFWDTRVMWLPHLPPNWRTDPRYIIGMTIESMSHDFDYMRWLVGDATSAMGRVSTSRPDLQGYDNITSCVLTLANGGMAGFNASWAAHEQITQYGIIGSDASVVYDHDIVRWKTGDGPEHVLEPNTPEDRISAHQRETQHFIHCLQTGETPSASVRDGVATLKISHAVLKSSTEGIVVPIA